jgi:ABC-type Fe3+/spermidine/putrescine transport system ATPase subunit
LRSSYLLQIENITKRFGDKAALQGINFDVIDGEILAILGPSGCGKSTLLSIIAGLETPDQGTIGWQGVPILDTPTHRRGFGLMFQDYALFPHMNVFENIAFGLKMVGLQHDAIQARVSGTLELVGLTGFADRDVNTLSGGEQQRVALARALAPRPRLLMFDEPLGSVDRTLRERLLFDLHHISKDVNQTALYVTHDQKRPLPSLIVWSLCDLVRSSKLALHKKFIVSPSRLLLRTSWDSPICFPARLSMLMKKSMLERRLAISHHDRTREKVTNLDPP